MDQIKNYFQNIYENIELYKEGGQCGVYSAKLKNNAKKVAIKITSISSAKSVLRFKREIATARSMEHPNIIKVLEDNIELYEKNNDPFLYLIMPFARYGSLAEHDFYQGDLGMCLHLFEKMMMGLRELHIADPDRELIHRDLKPENILFVNSEKEPVVADFGLVGFTHLLSEVKVTDLEERVGNRDFVAPEQFNDPSKAVQKSDIYSMGKILYCMLSGEKHLLGSHGIRQFNVTKIDELIKDCMKDLPEKRPSADEVIERVGVILNPPPKPKDEQPELDWIEIEILRLVDPNGIGHSMFINTGFTLKEIVDHINPLINEEIEFAHIQNKARFVLEKINSLVDRRLLFKNHNKYSTKRIPYLS